MERRTGAAAQSSGVQPVERATSNEHRKEITVVGHRDDKYRRQGTGYGHRSRPQKFATVVISKTKESKIELNIRRRRVRVGHGKGRVNPDSNRTGTRRNQIESSLPLFASHQAGPASRFYLYYICEKLN